MEQKKAAEILYDFIIQMGASDIKIHNLTLEPKSFDRMCTELGLPYEGKKNFVWSISSGTVSVTRGE